MGIHKETIEVLDTASFRSCRVDTHMFGAMSTPNDFYNETIHTVAINTRETEFGSIVEPIPITLKAIKQFPSNGHNLAGYVFPAQQTVDSHMQENVRPSTSHFQHQTSPKMETNDTGKIRPPPKKKWIRDYLEEEPKSPLSARLVSGLSVAAHSNGVVRQTSPVPLAPCPPALPAAAATTLEPVPGPAASTAFLDFVQEHSKPHAINNSHGLPQIPSPPSVNSNGSGSGSSGSGGSAPRAGTREVHNKLEKNRRAHLKECFELLKRQLPATPEEKKTSNLSILHSAIRYIHVLRRKERECEHEMERLAREKIAAQQRIAALKRELSVRATTARPLSIDTTEEKDREDRLNGMEVLGIPISISTSPPQPTSRVETSPSRTLNLSTKLRTLPIQITPTTSQVVRTTYGARNNTLTLTTLAPAETTTQNAQPAENGVTSTISTTLVHPTQLHIPLSQVVGSGGLVVGPAALQLLSAGGGLRVLQAPSVHANGENNRISRENGIVSPTPAVTENGSVVVSGLTPIVVSQPAAAAHLLHTHTLAHKMVETQVVKGSVAPLTVSAQYLSATTIVKPVVVVSGAHSPPAPGT